MHFGESIRYCCADLIGPIPQEQLGLLQAVCAGAEQVLRGKLRKTADPETFADTFVLACALFSVSTLRELESQGLSDFTAATVKLSFSDAPSRLGRLALQMLAPWCDDGFAFKGVRA